jgi:hypothetical protein
MTLKDVIQEGTLALSSLYPEREAREMVYLALEKILGTTRHTHILEPYYKVSDEDLVTVRDVSSRWHQQSLSSMFLMRPGSMEGSSMSLPMS